MTNNISTSTNESNPEPSKVAPTANPPVAPAEKKAEDTRPLKS